MLIALAASLLAQSPVCELSPRRTAVTMWQPLQLPDGTKFGVLAPFPCPLRSAEVTSSGTIDPAGVAHAAFDARGFRVDSVFSPPQLFSPNGFPVRISLVTTSPEACQDLSLMPAAGLPNSDGFEFQTCGRADIDDRWVECGTRVELYVRHAVGARTDEGDAAPPHPTRQRGRLLLVERPQREAPDAGAPDRTEQVGSIEAHTAIIPLTARDGFTQVSPFDPVPFRLHDGWTWWVRTSALEGCHQPR